MLEFGIKFKFENEKRKSLSESIESNRMNRMKRIGPIMSKQIMEQESGIPSLRPLHRTYNHGTMLRMKLTELC